MNIKAYTKKYTWLKNVTSLPNSDITICEVPISFLKDNPKNWRTHSKRQRETYKAFAEKYGWLGFAIFNLQSGYLVDGHMRASEALKKGDATVPCILVDLAEDGENEVLATLDNIGLMAQRNADALQSLLKSQNSTQATLKSDIDRKLAQLRKDVGESILEAPTGPLLKQAKTRLRPVASSPEESEHEGEVPDEYEPTREPEALQTIIDESVLFPGTTFLGIPILLEEHLATPEDAPTRTWFKNEPDGDDAYYCISNRFEEGMDVGTIGFYTDDHRFNDAFANATAFVDYLTQINPKCLIGPDFTAFTWFPPVMSLYSIYKSRWCSRLWQEVGYKIIPSIQVVDIDFTLTKEYVLGTLPKNTPVVSLECRNIDKDKYHLIPKLVTAIVKIVKPKCIVLYGGKEKQKYIHGDMPKKIDYRYLPCGVNEVRKKTRKQ